MAVTFTAPRFHPREFKPSAYQTRMTVENIRGPEKTRSKTAFEVVIDAKSPLHSPTATEKKWTQVAVQAGTVCPILTAALTQSTTISPMFAIPSLVRAR